VFVIIITFASPLFAGERELYQHIHDQTSMNNPDILKECKLFLKRYPQSHYAVEIHIRAALSESSPAAALSHYETVMTRFKQTPLINDVRLSACDLYFLSSKYDKCSKLALSALKTRIDHEELFIHYLVRSYILMQDFDAASEALNQYGSLLGRDERLVLSQCIASKTGNSLPTDSAKKQIGPTELMIIARDFELRRMINQAYSAYRDLSTRYPRSPEAMASKGNLATLEKGSPHYTAKYRNDIPRDKVMPALTPEHPITESGSDLRYSVLIGPIPNLKDAKSLKKEMTDEFDAVVIVRGDRGFFIYAGDEPSADRAMDLRIRLAEEFGLNGKIVQRKEESGREYIYGE
jgi:hypothetical protein